MKFVMVGLGAALVAVLAILSPTFSDAGVQSRGSRPEKRMKTVFLIMPTKKLEEDARFL
jgi:hypothetical protein